VTVEGTFFWGFFFVWGGLVFNLDEVFLPFDEIADDPGRVDRSKDSFRAPRISSLVSPFYEPSVKTTVCTFWTPLPWAAYVGAAVGRLRIVSDPSPLSMLLFNYQLAFSGWLQETDKGRLSNLTLFRAT